MIELCPIHMVDAVWPRLQAGFHRACQKGGNQFSEAGLRLTCRSGGAYLCLMLEEGTVNAGVVCQEQQWCDRQVLFVLAATGIDAVNWWEPMAEWSAGQFPGCTTLIFEGRPGLGKMPGVKVLRHVFEMDMSHGTVLTRQ